MELQCLFPFPDLLTGFFLADLWGNEKEPPVGKLVLDLGNKSMVKEVGLSLTASLFSWAENWLLQPAVCRAAAHGGDAH